MIDFNPLYSSAGLGVGLLVGLTGVGGGSLMTPLLVLAFGFHPATAVGTDLLYASMTKAVGTAVHGAGGTVDWRIVRRLAAGSVPAAVLTLAWLRYLGSQGGTTDWLTPLLGVALLATAVAMVFRHRIVGRYAAQFAEIAPQRIGWLTTALGVMLGIMVSLTSVGAGALGMTALLLLYPTQPASRLVGSDIAHAVPLTLIAGIGHWALGSVDVSLLLSLLAGSIPGIVIGSLASRRLSDRALTPLLAVTLALVGIKLVL